MKKRNGIAHRIQTSAKLLNDTARDKRVLVKTSDDQLGVNLVVSGFGAWFQLVHLHLSGRWRHGRARVLARIWGGSCGIWEVFGGNWKIIWLLFWWALRLCPNGHFCFLFFNVSGNTEVVITDNCPSVTDVFGQWTTYFFDNFCLKLIILKSFLFCLMEFISLLLFYTVFFC